MWPRCWDCDPASPVCLPPFLTETKQQTQLPLFSNPKPTALPLLTPLMLSTTPLEPCQCESRVIRLSPPSAHSYSHYWWPSFLVIFGTSLQPCCQHTCLHSWCFSGHIGSANTLSSLWIILAHPASATGACHLTLVHALRHYHNDNHITFIIVVSCILLSDHSHFLSRPSLEHPNSISLPTPQDLWSIYLPHFHCPLSYFPAFCSMNSMDSGYKQIIAYTFRFSILCSSYFLVKTTILAKI